jgi:anti-sigma-K factor RskA
MPDFHSPEDEATLYVLGELTAAERRAFEARLAQSAELRALVRDLEEGVVALSTGLPARRPPSEVWSGIEKTVCRESRRTVPAWRIGWWRNGWAAAAACLAGWLLYAVFLNGRYGSIPATPQPLHESAITNSTPTVAQAVVAPSAPTNDDHQLLQARAEEIRDLRLKLSKMEKQTGQLAQLLVQQRAQLGESNRIKFYQLSSASANGDAAATPLSPALQRAVFLSIGRELGWFPGESNLRGGIGADGRVLPHTFGGVDFIDLRKANNEPANPPPVQPKPESQTAESQTAGPQVAASQAAGSQVADAPAPVIPAFVSGDKLVVAVDSTIVPPNSSVTFSLAGASPGTTGGTISFVGIPTVLTIPLPAGSTSDGGFILTTWSTTFTGVSNTMQFFSLPIPSP